MLTAALGALVGVAMNQAKKQRAAAAAMKPLHDQVQRLQGQVDALRAAPTAPARGEAAATATAATAEILVAPTAPAAALDVSPAVAPPQEQPPLPVDAAADASAPDATPVVPPEVEVPP